MVRQISGTQDLDESQSPTEDVSGSHIRSWRRSWKDYQDPNNDAEATPLFVDVDVDVDVDATSSQITTSHPLNDQASYFLSPSISPSTSDLQQISTSICSSLPIIDPDIPEPGNESNSSPLLRSISSTAPTEYTDPSSFTASATAAHDAMRRMLKRDLRRETTFGISVEKLGTFDVGSEDDFGIESLSNPGDEDVVLVPRPEKGWDEEMGWELDSVEPEAKLRQVLEKLRIMDFDEFQEPLKIVFGVVGVLIIGGGVFALLWVMF